MKKNSASQSAFFNSRVLLAFALCSCGVLLGMFSLAATPPVETTRASTTLPPDPRNFPSTAGSNANQLPPDVPLPAGAQFSLNNRQSANSLGNPVLADPQTAPPNLTPGSAAQIDWSIVNSPNIIQTTTIALQAVTCVSASDCWAVGSYGDRFTGQTLIEHWNGAAWAIVTSPNTSAMDGNVLSSVTCVSASECWAVGASNVTNPVTGKANYQTLVERWDGNSWAIVTSANAVAAQDNVLQAVTCVSASDCWAVGYFGNSIPAQTLVERWDGTSWAIVTSAITNAAQVLQAVTCVSASDCWAVGYYFNGGIEQTLIERWDGTSWTISASPNNSTTQNNQLYGVTCPSASECWAVGWHSGSARQTLVERWDGTSWVIVDSANTSPEIYNTLTSVTCASASDCWAVGYHGTADAQASQQTLVEHWDGNSWAVIDLPSTSGTADNAFQAITCVSASNCWAVGYNAQTLVEHWNGNSWAVVSSPNTSNRMSNLLQSVTCVSASDCWAVGSYSIASRFVTLAEHWDGNSWAVVSSPNTTNAKDYNSLQAVTCVSSSDCWAVGYYVTILPNGAYIHQTLIEHWDGTSWAITPSPNVGFGRNNDLEGVTCASASDCWAVGDYLIGSNYQTLSEHWDGTSWAIVSSPNAPNTDPGQWDVLNGVTCVSTSDCWAVGYNNNFTSVEGTSEGSTQTLVEHWDGTSWTIATSPNPGTSRSSVLRAVTCVSASNCFAVGSDSSTGQTLIERWDGTSWAIVSSPNTTATLYNNLYGVACASASDCWAVGSSARPLTNSQNLIEHWDGTSWAIATSPNTNATDYDDLVAVTCASASDCWAVGTSDNNNFAVRTLIQHYGLPFVQLNAAASRKTHGSVGTFDVDLLNGSPSIECRSGGANGDYTLVFTFANPLTSVGGASVTSGTGTVSSRNIDSNDAHNYIVNLTGVTNAQAIKVSLTSVTDSAGDFSSAVPASMAVLIGDVNGNSVVSNTDVASVKAQVAAPVTSSNFRSDVNANGVISNTDVSLAKAQVGTALP